MTNEDAESENREARRHKHHAEHEKWPAPTSPKEPPPTHTKKALHHPATRIAEIKHGKS